MLLFLLINFIIACIGFGSGTVFLGYIFDAYSQYTEVSTQALNIATSISMVLPAPFSPKMLGIIAYQSYGFWFIWPALFAFTIPTYLIANFTYINYNKLKDSLFFSQLSKYFPPIMGAITLNIILLLIIQNINSNIQLLFVIIPSTTTLITRFVFKVENTGGLLIISTISLWLTFILCQ